MTLASSRFLGCINDRTAPGWPGTSTLGRRRCSSEADKAWQLCFCPAVDLQKWENPNKKSCPKLLPGNPKKSNKTKTPETIWCKVVKPNVFPLFVASVWNFPGGVGTGEHVWFMVAGEVTNEKLMQPSGIHCGKLVCLVVNQKGTLVPRLLNQYMGATSCSTCMSYMDLSWQAQFYHCELDVCVHTQIKVTSWRR